ncbi:MAG: DUF5655 domain-containing protein [Bacteroidota bacterium]
MNDGFERLFDKKTDEVINICKTFIQLAQQHQNIRISPLKNAILFAVKSNFFAVKPKKNMVDIEFLLDDEVNEFPVYKTQKVYGNKYAHFIKIQKVDEIDAQLIEWFQLSFNANIRV